MLQRRQPVKIPKPKETSDDCEIEVKQTRTGRKIKIYGKCRKEQLQIFAREQNIKIEEE